MKPKLTKPDIYSNCCLECGFPSLTAHYDGCSKTTKPKTDKQGWEEEFDNKVKEMPKKLIELVEWNKIKDFIRQLYQQALAEGKRIGREEVMEEMKRDIKKPFNKKEFVKLANEVSNILAEEKRTMTGAYDATTRAGKKRFRDMLRELVE